MKTMEIHKREAPKKLRFAVLTISTSKFEKMIKNESVDDLSGRIIIEHIKNMGCETIFYTILPDHKGIIQEFIKYIIDRYNPDVIITTGGTGITRTDVTIEALEELFEKRLDGFGEYFRRLSVEKSGLGAIISRATAGIYKSIVIFSLPGSPDAVKIGMDIISREVFHIVKHAKE